MELNGPVNELEHDPRVGVVIGGPFSVDTRDEDILNWRQAPDARARGGYFYFPKVVRIPLASRGNFVDDAGERLAFAIRKHVT